MSSLILAIFFICFNSPVHAQAPQKKKHAQQQAGQKQNHKSDAVVTQDIVYGSNVNWKGQNEALKLDIYTPPRSNKKYPLILFVHGGGFMKGDKASANTFARMMVDKGFIVASINYRLGWDQGTKKSERNEKSATEAVYRGLQDAKASLRFLTAHASEYDIDTNWIFVSGSSAGGVTSLNIIFADQKNMNASFPNLEKKLGPLDSGSNPLTNKYTIKAIVPMWGAVNSLDLITKEKAVPTLFFHGAKDNVVPYDVSHWYTIPTFSLGYGSKPVYEKLTSLGVPAVAYIDPEGGHGVYSARFRADITACFLNKVMKHEPQTGFYVSTEEVQHCP